MFFILPFSSALWRMLVKPRFMQKGGGRSRTTGCKSFVGNFFPFSDWYLEIRVSRPVRNKYMQPLKKLHQTNLKRTTKYVFSCYTVQTMMFSALDDDVVTKFLIFYYRKDKVSFRGCTFTNQKWPILFWNRNTYTHGRRWTKGNKDLLLLFSRRNSAIFLVIFPWNHFRFAKCFFMLSRSFAARFSRSDMFCDGLNCRHRFNCYLRLQGWREKITYMYSKN